MLWFRRHEDGSLVALRKESVDRNSWAARARVAQYWSLSARRAWIEIVRARSGRARSGSLSARRAWIEISAGRVAPTAATGRSPQGERG